MTKVMIFNPATLEQREVTETDADRAEREMGWVRVGGANELLAVYHPGQNRHAMILKRDLPVWEQKGYYAEPTYVYHPDEGTRLVPAEEAERLYDQGWYRNPGQFPTATTDALVEKAVKAAKGK